MKNIIQKTPTYIIIAFSILFVGCSEKNKYKFEDMFYKCLNTNYQEDQNRHVDQLLDSIEMYLAEDGIIDLQSQSVYSDLVDTMAQFEEDFRFSIDTEHLLFESFYNNTPGMRCHEEPDADTNGFFQSKFVAFMDHTTHYYEGPIQSYFEEFHDLLDSSDMHHPAYQFLILASFSHVFVFPAPTSCWGSSLWRICYSCQEKELDRQITFQDTIQFYMDSYHETRINNVPHSMDSIAFLVSEILLENFDQANLSKRNKTLEKVVAPFILLAMDYSETTSRNSMADLEEVIAEGYRISWDTLSNRFLSKDYSDLDYQMEMAIQEKIPLYWDLD